MTKPPILQKHGFGCGVACVAFACDVTYDVAATQLGSRKAATVGFRCKELVSFINSRGGQYSFKHINKYKNRPPEGSIVFIRRSKRYPYGHYLIRSQGLWMDPWINLPFDKDIDEARAGYRQRLPGKAQWVLFPVAFTDARQVAQVMD